jgi:hypothetical protein
MDGKSWGRNLKGHLEVLQWMEKVGVGNAYYAATHAVAGRHLDILIWLHKHGKIFYSDDLMYFAAKKGDLHIVKWLHYNRNDRGSKLTVELAAENGHLEVVKWLITNRDDGYTWHAVRLAAKNGHHEVAELLTNFAAKLRETAERKLGSDTSK